MRSTEPKIQATEAFATQPQTDRAWGISERHEARSEGVFILSYNAMQACLTTWRTTMPGSIQAESPLQVHQQHSTRDHWP